MIHTYMMNGLAVLYQRTYDIIEMFKFLFSNVETCPRLGKLFSIGSLCLISPVEPFFQRAVVFLLTASITDVRGLQEFFAGIFLIVRAFLCALPTAPAAPVLLRGVAGTADIEPLTGAVMGMKTVVESMPKGTNLA